MKVDLLKDCIMCTLKIEMFNPKAHMSIDASVPKVPPQRTEALYDLVCCLCKYAPGKAC